MSDVGAKILPFPLRRRLQSPGDGSVTFAAFQEAVAASRAGDAGRILSALLGVDEALARRAAEHFVRALTEQPELADKARRLERELRSSATNNALVLLMDCFGLTIGEAVHAYGNLRQAFP